MHEDEKNMGNAAAIIAEVRRTTEPQTIIVNFEGEDEQVIVTSNADGETVLTTVRDLFADRATAPVRRKGTIVVHDLASFIAAVNRDSDADSVIFADAPGRELTAILDFHQTDGDGPRWCQDRIKYGFTLSPQLTAWMKAAERPMDQKTFARLIDDRIGDVGDGANLEAGSIAADFAERRKIKFADVRDLLVFTRTIAAKSSVVSSESYDENTGDTSIVYGKKNDVSTPDGASITPPAAFVLRIPILCGSEAMQYNIAVRLRFDVDGQRIMWRVELHALDKYVNAAIEESLVIVRGPKQSDVPNTAPGCGLPVFMGVAPTA